VYDSSAAYPDITGWVFDGLVWNEMNPNSWSGSLVLSPRSRYHWTASHHVECLVVPSIGLLGDEDALPKESEKDC